MEKLRTLVICRALLLSATSDELRSYQGKRGKKKQKVEEKSERQALRGLSV